MLTSKNSVTLKTEDFPVDTTTKQVWIKIDGLDIHAVIGSDGSLKISRWISKSKYRDPGRVKISTYRY